LPAVGCGFRSSPWLFLIPAIPKKILENLSVAFLTILPGNQQIDLNQRDRDSNAFVTNYCFDFSVFFLVKVA